jgi:plasmid replication initiation protein
MSLQELRFFSIYLSKINKNDVSTRTVRFPLADFRNIMELGRMDVNYLKKVTDGLLCKVVNVPNERGGYTGFQLFKECKVDTDEKNGWYIEISAHDKALPLMFDFRDRYFSYQLWNALRLRSRNQIRIYEILKQYEHIGSRALAIDELRELLGIDKHEYPRYGDFKTRVLDACQRALREYTDIKFTYEPHGKRGKAGKILFLKFTIEKNTDFVDQLSLDMFIEENRQDEQAEQAEFPPDIGETADIGLSPYEKRVIFLLEACNNEFTKNEISVLVKEMKNSLPWEMFRDDVQIYDYLSDKYHELLMRAEKTKIKHRFAYLRSIIGKDYEP